MATLNFSQDDRLHAVDGTLEEIGDGASALGKHLKCRVQPWLYDWRVRNYTSWSGLAWTLELEDVAEGRRLRQALTYVFAAFAGDAKRQKKLLQELKAWAAEEGE
jgi:hypothetical protein